MLNIRKVVVSNRLTLKFADMLKIVTGLVFILHGLVHILYFGQSAHFFELKEGFKWPKNSWAFSHIFSKKAVRIIACNFCILSALGFVAGGIALFAENTNWYDLIIGSAVFSSILFILFWDGQFDHFDNKGGIGVLINAAIFVLLVFMHWPVINF